MNRREFTRHSALIGTSLGLGIFNACSSPKKADRSSYSAESEDIKPFFKLSLAQWSIHRAIQNESINPMNFAVKAREWGFEGVEYVSHLYHKQLNSGLSMNNLVKELNKRASDNGVRNLVLMVDLPPGEGDISVTNDAKRTRAIEMHYPLVEVTAGLNCHSMRINMFGELEADAWKSASIDGLARLGEFAAKQKVNVIIENHGWLTSNAKLLMEVIDEVDMNNVGTLPDFGNFCTRRKDGARWGECEEEYDKYLGIEQLMPRAKAVSAKSYDFDENGLETTINYKRMLQIVKDAGYTGYIGVEYEGERLSEEDGIKTTRDLLIRIGKELV